nr:retrotransposon protein, putative, Ty1-copia subclass [Tanacetum cinerariifolium]
MVQELKTVFEEQAKQELFKTVKAFHACKQEEGQSVSSYLLKMKSYLDILEHLGFDMPNELGVSLILKDYYKFIQNYIMHSMGKTIVELHAMLKLHDKDNVFYFNAIPRDGIYEINMQNLYPNDSSMYNVSNKGAKHALDFYYLLHCHLGHINKKSVDKLQRDGILRPTHDESLNKCKSCIYGKMARKPFPYQVKRSKDLLGLIHTDVCGPFRTMSRVGASYFITFTDDFSRYGYVYMMKHKHEIFEIFKVFQNEVENQLVKKIKAIRSDRGSEYLSHEFVNHMKSYGIVSCNTPKMARSGI